MAAIIPLRVAILCVNCDAISDGEKGRCSFCGSPNVIPLSNLLGELCPKPEDSTNHTTEPEGDSHGHTA